MTYRPGYSRLTPVEEAQKTIAVYWQGLRERARDLRGWPEAPAEWQIAVRTTMLDWLEKVKAARAVIHEHENSPEMKEAA